MHGRTGGQAEAALILSEQLHQSIYTGGGALPGGPVAERLPSNAGDVGMSTWLET